MSIRQRFAVAKLTAFCEGLASNGRLSELQESALRQLIVETQNAFDMPTRAERTDNQIVDLTNIMAEA